MGVENCTKSERCLHQMMGNRLRERVEKGDENKGLRKEGRSNGVGIQAGA